MSVNSGGLSCAAMSWGLAAVLGAVAGVLLAVLGDWSFMQAVFAAVIVAVAVGLFLMLTICRSLPAPANTKAEAPKAEAPKAAAPKAAPSVATAAPKPAAAPKAAAPKAAAKPKTAAKPKAAAPKAAVKPKTDPAPVAGDAGSKPATLSAARASGADDLKMIKGVGPKLEKMLNGMGFYHFDQIAAWKAEEVAWVDQNLEGFKGRVSRDNWVEQAKTLAAGGQTEFSKRVGDGEVY